MFYFLVAGKMSRKSRKRKSDGEDHPTTDGDQDNFFSDEIREEMEIMWEVITIFDRLCGECLIVIELSLTSCFSHVAFSDTTNFPLSSSDEGISQYTSIVDVWNGEDAFDTKSVEAVGKHHDVSAKVVTSITRYMSNCLVIFDSRWREKKITRMTKINR